MDPVSVAPRRGTSAQRQGPTLLSASGVVRARPLGIEYGRAYVRTTPHTWY